MKYVFLLRDSTSDQGSFGKFITSGFTCNTIELPWRDNIVDKSCIKAGTYLVKMRKSPKFGWCYWLSDCDRLYILTHYGNLAGDTEKGFKTHSLGCIIVGKYRGLLNGQKAVLLSRPTLNNFVDHMNREDFKLEIMWEEGVCGTQ